MSNLSSDSQKPSRRLNDDLVVMARCLATIGPNINEIARRTGQYKETVRYRYHKFFLDKGLTIQAMPNYSKLGFKRIILIAKLAPASDAHATSIFSAMSDMCYLHSFTRVLLSGTFVIHVAVPSQLAERCAALYGALQEAGLFTELEILAFDEIRNAPMKPEYFDFGNQTWSFDWSAAKAKPIHLVPSPRPEVEKYDKTDLIILKEFDKDASRPLVKMVEKVKVNLKALEFHYQNHVQGRGLIKGYRLIWQGSHYDSNLEKTVSRKDVYIELTILLSECSPSEKTELMSLLNKTPFLWSEAYSSAYCAEVFLPNHAYNDFLEYIGEFANRLGDRLRILVMDQTQALRFVMAYNLFDNETKTWRLDEGNVLKALANLPLAKLSSS
ncbi:MAG: hypothetical protein OK455_10235 [Thaumarchaeota archaeon]|nr:hypothetical protein [Nitrososphaerota archaeon]